MNAVYDGAHLEKGVAKNLDLKGVLFVSLSALMWSFGGAIARFIPIEDIWTVVFWRSLFASLFLIGFMLVRDGGKGMLLLFRRMGFPGLIVAVCFATASISFVLALRFTTIANVVLIGAGVPLFAALIGWIVLRTPVSRATWIAIAAVICGIAIMVSGSVGEGGSWIGGLLAFLMTVSFAVLAVTTRHYNGVRMTPAVALGTALAALVAASLSSGLAVSLPDLGMLAVFGAFNLGLGMAFYVTGARLIPAPLAGLIGTAETVLSPFWGWVAHGETPGSATLIGGGVVFAALITHVSRELWRKET